ncbi:hypothetical protein [Streptomyces sp. NPDC050263]|uniref:hypothetical protein n=1 Tax=Streptomyces sp. NPDC050263 TaxID=3155037 RepID=UPI0034215BB2
MSKRPYKPGDIIDARLRGHAAGARCRAAAPTATVLFDALFAAGADGSQGAADGGQPLE